MHPGGLLPWAEVSLVINVYTIGNCVEALRGAQVFHDGEQFVFALKTTLPVVAGILRTLEFRGGNNLEGDSLLLGEGDGIRQMSPREAGRISDDCQHIRPQDAMRSPGE